MPHAALHGGHVSGLAMTHRKDAWWIAPFLTVLGFGAFIVYTTWAALQGEHYWYGSYLSPFYSPLLFIDSSAAGAAPLEHAWFGSWPTWWPAMLPSSPALFILMFPGVFRFTCYYYRKAYYRSFVGTPPACAVGALPRKSYLGETALLLFQNFHRYALYPAIAFVFILYYDAVLAFFHDGRFGIGVGTVILLTNATLLGCYTFGCHSFRHLVGGRLNCFSCDKQTQLRYGTWKRVSCLNERHMMWAWISLFWVGFSDLYVRLCSMGIIHDFNTWGF
ncbi:MAG: succinate dehydrogenase [Deltaproteobacteria bacterium]|nr:succinate dehydrogenase [Deltaproteobacteria bacterium]